MKNSNNVRRLRLRRETILALQDDQLGAARGGATGTEVACYTAGPKPCCTTAPELCSGGTWSGINCQSVNCQTLRCV